MRVRFEDQREEHEDTNYPNTEMYITDCVSPSASKGDRTPFGEGDDTAIFSSPVINCGCLEEALAHYSRGVEICSDEYRCFVEKWLAEDIKHSLESPFDLVKNGRE